MKKSVSLFLALIIVLASILSVAAAAEGNIDYAGGVTDAMCKPSYWYDKGLFDSDEVLMTAEEIAKVNQAAIDGTGTNVVGLFNIKATYDADKQRNNLSNFEIPTRDLYVDGKEINNKEYFGAFISAIKATGYTGTSLGTQYAVCTKRATLKAYPTDDIIGYSDADPDDEYASSGLCVNEPFAIRQKCDINGETFYWGYSLNCTGWINGKDLAICKDREQWYDACRVELDAKDFIVVTEDKIVTEPSMLVPYSSEVKLTIGTILKLVPKDEIPEQIGERRTWNNYVVYLPVRDSKGMYQKQPALISQHCNVSVGFLPFTQKNLLDVAFSCLGNRYGWAGAFDSMDCSLYTRNIYRCFGFEIPRNTTWQQNVPNTLISMSGMTDEQKEQFIETLPIGSLLYFSGHTMMYIGTQNGLNYVISDLGTVVDTEGEVAVKKIYSVVLNPLTVRRKDGTTWLHNLTSAVVVMPKVNVEKCNVKAVRDESGEVNVSVSLNSKGLYEDVNYTVELSDDSVTVSGINNFSGSVTVKITQAKVRFIDKIIGFFRSIFSRIAEIVRGIKLF